MSKQHYFRGALNAAEFPFVSSFQGRTVVQPGLDNNVRTTQAFYGNQQSADYSIPQLLYCENVLPTGEGLQSVGYEQLIEGLPGISNFDQAITLRDADENNFIFVPASGMNYIYRANTGTWTSTNPVAAADATVSRAYVNGRTFVCYSGLGIYEYNTGANTFVKLTLIGLTDAAVSGIGSSNNYLVAFTDITVYWSSLIDPVDFIPSTLTGAGFAIPQDVKAKITAVVGTSGGFIIYTAKNAVAAVYTNNIRAPFSFKEVSNAGGLESYEQVTSEQTSGPQFAWTTGGFQTVVPQGADTISGEVNDFLAGGLWEYWEPISKQLIETSGGGVEFKVKLSYVASRFVIISYSVDSTDLYQYALVFDVVLERWGKLKIDHVDCFSYPYPNVFGDLTYGDLSGTSYEGIGETSYAGLAAGIFSRTPSKRSVAFLSTNGAVNILLMNYSKEVAQQGVAIFGKFQLIRDKMLTLQEIDFEGIYSDTTGPQEVPLIAATLLASRDGKNLSQAFPMRLLAASKKHQKYAKRATGKNLSIALEGTFALSSYILTVTAEGDR